MLESTHSFAAYQEELKKNAVKKSAREGKLDAVLAGGEKEEAVVDGEGADSDSFESKKSSDDDQD